MTAHLEESVHSAGHGTNKVSHAVADVILIFRYTHTHHTLYLEYRIKSDNIILVQELCLAQC